MMNKAIVHGAGLAGVILIAAAAFKLAEAGQWIGHDVAVRGGGAVIGLALAIYANFIPKSLAVAARPGLIDRGKSTMRVAGWAFVFAGLGYAASWAFAPMDLAFPLSVGLVGGAICATLGHGAWACRRRAVSI